MSKYLLFESIAMIILMISGGCSTSDDYRCESNDLCSSTTDWQYYSCSNDTGHCEKVNPLAIDPSTLLDATIGQSDYRVELTASGGIPPYTWSLARGDEEKLKWLTITPEGDAKAILHNSTDTNNEPLYPSEMNVGIPLTITLVDSSKHGTAVREDNQGKASPMTIKINDCPHKCKRFSDSDDNPTANENDTQCTIDAQCSCAKQYICKSYPPSPNACVKWEEEMKCDSKCNTSGTKCCLDECAPSDYPKCVPSQDPGGKAAFSTCGYDLIKNDGCFYKTESLCDGNVCKEQQCGECSNLSNSCNQQDATRCVDVNQERCIIDPTTTCLVWSSPMPCDNYKTCQDGNCKYVVGTYGAGGGIIYYINPNYDPTCALDSDHFRCNWQYLEAAPEDQSSSATWGPVSKVVTGSGLGAGVYNTSNITNSSSDTTIAAWLCRNYSSNGMKDWFLPSVDELTYMYYVKGVIPNISKARYWSSTQHSDPETGSVFYHSYFVDFNSTGSNPYVDAVLTVIPYYVRCVRGETKL